MLGILIGMMQVAALGQSAAPPQAPSASPAAPRTAPQVAGQATSQAAPRVATQAAPQAATPAVPPPAATSQDEIVTRILGTSLFARIELPGFSTEDRTAKAMKMALGSRGLVVGVLPEEGASVQLVVDKEGDTHLSDSEWRDFNLKESGSSWKYFDLPGMLGGESTLLFEGSGSHDFHAFTVRAGCRIDFHMAESFDTVRKPKLTRARFTNLVGTFRLAVVRFGSWRALPASALDMMDLAFQRPADWKSKLDEQAKAHPEDSAIPFAQAEVARFLGAPPAEQIDAYAKAVAALAPLAETGDAERTALVLAEDGLALAHLDAGDAAKAVPHLESAQKWAARFAPAVRAAILFDRARVDARSGPADVALHRLFEAERLDPGSMRRAMDVKDFAVVCELEGYKRFVHGDR